jgi:hypothetical protein
MMDYPDTSGNLWKPAADVSGRFLAGFQQVSGRFLNSLLL